MYTNSANECISLSDSFLAGFLGGFAGGLTLNPVLGGALSGGITNGLNSRYSGGSRAHQGASAMLGGIVGIGTGAVAGYVGGFSNKIVAGASSAAAGTTANVVLSLSGSELGCTCPR